MFMKAYIGSGWATGGLSGKQVVDQSHSPLALKIRIFMTTGTDHRFVTIYSKLKLTAVQINKKSEHELCSLLYSVHIEDALFIDES